MTNTLTPSILVPGLTVEPTVRIVRVRELPIRGRVTVAVGDTVTAQDEVLRTEMPGDLVVIRVAERFGISPAEAMHTMLVKPGTVVEQGQVVARHRGLFGLFEGLCEAPEAGTVEFVAAATGHIGVRRPAQELSVRAYIAGRIVSITEGRRVSIESEAALVQGIFGVGGERSGTIVILDIGPNDEPRIEHLPSDATGCILVGGTCPAGKVLQRAAERGAVGFVCGGIKSEALSEYLGFEIGVAITGDEDISMSVIITEGFGSLGLSQRVLDVLSPHRGRLASLSGATQVRAGAIRPEVIVSGVPLEAASDQGQVGLRVGASIRIIREPHFGAFAQITELPREPAKLPSGALVRVLKARLTSGQEVQVARANVELCAG